jgi:hypothetical protein
MRLFPVQKKQIWLLQVSYPITYQTDSSGNPVNRDHPLYNQLPKERAALEQCHRATMPLFQRP